MLFLVLPSSCLDGVRAEVEARQCGLHLSQWGTYVARLVKDRRNCRVSQRKNGSLYSVATRMSLLLRPRKILGKSIRPTRLNSSDCRWSICSAASPLQGQLAFSCTAVEELLEFLRNGFKKLLVGFGKESFTGLRDGKAIAARVVLEVVQYLSVPPLSDFFFR